MGKKDLIFPTTYLKAARTGLASALQAAQTLMSLPEFLDLLQALLAMPLPLQLQSVAMVATKAAQAPEHGALFLPILAELTAMLRRPAAEVPTDLVLACFKSISWVPSEGFVSNVLRVLHLPGR